MHSSESVSSCACRHASQISDSVIFRSWMGLIECDKQKDEKLMSSWAKDGRMQFVAVCTQERGRNSCSSPHKSDDVGRTLCSNDLPSSRRTFVRKREKIM